MRGAQAELVEENAVGELPTGWAEAKLGDFLPLAYGKALPARSRNEDGDFPVYGSSGSVGKHNNWLAPASSIIVGRKGSAGAVYFSDKPCWPIDTAYFAVPLDGFEPRYWYFQLLALQLGRLDQSTAIPSLSRDNYNPIVVNVPPANEQERIVSKIDELFSDIEAGERALKRARAALARYRKSVLKAAVTGELTADWREANKDKLEPADKLLARILAARRAAWEKAERARIKAKGKPPKGGAWKQKYKEPVGPTPPEGISLPENWAWAGFNQIGEFGRGKSKHRPRNDPKLFGGEYPFLQTGIVRQSNGRIREYEQTYNEFGLAQSKLWPGGTICITIAANIAASGILEIDACFPDSVVGLVPDKEVQGRYIELFIRTAKAELDRFAPATAQKNINLEILSDVAIPFPPADEQIEIVSRADEALSKADHVEAALDEQERAARALKQSILKAAFEGRLVPQNPTDEPASTLLNQIKTRRS